MPFEGGSNSSYTRDYSGHGTDAYLLDAIWNSTAGYDGSGAYQFSNTLLNIRVEEAEKNNNWLSFKVDLKFRSSSILFILSGIFLLISVLVNIDYLFFYGLSLLFASIFYLSLVIFYFAFSMEKF